MVKIGSHVSFKSPNYIIDSYNESISNGANVMMIYLGPPQSTIRVDVSKYNWNKYIENDYDKVIKPIDIIIHAPYIINLANIEKSNFGKEFLINEIKRMNHLDARYIVLHPGSSLKQDVDESLKHLASNIKDILNNTNDVEILLETMSGKGTELCSSFEQIESLIKLIDDERVGVCLDTCHIWDAGYDIKDDFENNNGNKLISELKKYNLLDKIKVIHLNDSKNKCNSHKDRHANIGQGFIGLKALKNIVHHPIFKNIPFILETPYIDNKSPYKEEIKLLKGEE